ncbi:MAG: aminopeptidase [Candidatus Poribacteria bacterium]|nr:aminopeptidase [Candidatus Poribacteria bacterium]
MHDPRLDKLANVLTTHSTKVQPGEFVLIEGIDIPQEMVIALIRAVRNAGGIPLVELKQNRIQREIILGGDDAGIKLIGEYEIYRMEKVQAYIGIRGSHNITEMSDVPAEAMQRYQKYWIRPLNDIRVPHTKWVVLRWPYPAMAQQAQMSTEAFEDYYFDVCTLDYSRMERAMVPLKSLMEETDEVHILGEGTDLRFSIKDIPIIPCAGEKNIPDGECFTAPVRDSVNGTIRFNTPTIYQGTTFTDIRLRFENGKIVEATANNTERLNAILDTDEGARYIGEFAIAFNPYIISPMLDILFDEKIAGSFHFTPGQAYEEADNGVRSAVHWDMVMIQTPEHGGGEMSFDGHLIRKDGRFVHPALDALNPENLI